MLETKRLILRQWRKSDFPLFAAMNADPVVMEQFPNALTTAESDEFAQRIADHIEQQGWGLWAVEHKSTKQFMGFVGLQESWSGLPFPVEKEIGWRLAKEYWGKGFATEAAQAVLQFAFKNLGLEKVISFTSISNKASRKVMERINMLNSQMNFMHPKLPRDNSLCEHVYYQISKNQWEKGQLKR